MALKECAKPAIENTGQKLIFYTLKSMTYQEHIRQILGEFSQIASQKYMTGVREHGGHLWEKKGLIDMAIEEAVDQVIYLLTLKKQIEDSGIQLGEKDET